MTDAPDTMKNMVTSMHNAICINLPFMLFPHNTLVIYRPSGGLRLDEISSIIKVYRTLRPTSWSEIVSISLGFQRMTGRKKNGSAVKDYLNICPIKTA
jgi:hypothetical protein